MQTPLSDTEPDEILEGSLKHLQGLHRGIRIEIDELRAHLADLERCELELAPLIKALSGRVTIRKARARWRQYSNARREAQEQAQVVKEQDSA